MKYSDLEKKYNMEQKDIEFLKNFIDGRFHLYYFKNFLDITSGDLDDAIKLYKLDTTLSNILSKFILKLELRMKHELLINIESKTQNIEFWNDPQFYRNAAVNNVLSNGKTQFSSLIEKIRIDLNNMTFSNITNSKVMYSISFGRFLKIFQDLKDEYKNDFVERFSNSNGYNEVKNYFSALKTIRNRCAHSNHVVSPKLWKALRSYKLYSLDDSYEKFGNNLCKSLLFIYNNLIGQDKTEFKTAIHVLFKDYKTVIRKYNGKHTIDKGMHEKIQKFFK